MMMYLLQRLALLLVLPFSLATAQEPTLTPLQGSTPAQWRVIWGADPAHEATISWTTAEEGKQHQVLIGLGGPGAPDKRVQAQRNGAYSLDGGETDTVAAAWYHHVRLADLRPATRYRFTIDSDGKRSRAFYFRTAPDDDQPFKLIYGGDSRTGHEARQQMNRLMSELIAEEPSILAFTHGGDYIQDGGRWSDWGPWLSHQELSTGRDGRVLPIVPVRGNHDGGPLYDEIFDDHGGKDLNYSTTQLSSKVAIVSLNSNISTTGDQALWLEEELDRLRPLNRWLLTQYHRPLYPAVKSPGPAKSTWVPLFEGFDVDLVLESDGHVMKRTMPIRNDEHDPSGVTYIGEGGLGVPQRQPDTERWYLKAPGMAARGHHVTVLSFEPDSLRMLTVGPAPSGADFVPQGFKSIVPKNGVWRYLAGSEPEADWASAEFQDANWPRGEAGFGFGDDDDKTVLEDMRRNYSRVYVRRRIPAGDLSKVESLALMMRYDDGFIAYVNGQEVIRVGVSSGRGATAGEVASHEAQADFEFFLLADWKELTRGDDMILCIEGHNGGVTSSDFTLDPFLIADPGNLPTSKGKPGRVTLDDHTLSPRKQ